MEGDFGFDTRVVGRCVCRDSLDSFMNALGAITWVRTTTTGGREKIELRCFAFQYDLADGDRTSLLDCDEWFVDRQAFSDSRAGFPREGSDSRLRSGRVA